MAMSGPHLNAFLAPTVTLGDKVYTFDLRPRDVATLKKLYGVDLFVKGTGEDEVGRMASILSVASHDPDLTPDFIQDNFRLGQITVPFKRVLENALAGDAPTP